MTDKIIKHVPGVDTVETPQFPITTIHAGERIPSEIVAESAQQLVEQRQFDRDVMQAAAKAAKQALARSVTEPSPLQLGGITSAGVPKHSQPEPGEPE